MITQSPFVETTTTRVNGHVDPVLNVWPWEVPADLFLAGLVAGLLVIFSAVVLLRKEEKFPTVVKWAPVYAIPLLSLGLFLLFLDLSYKLHAFRFYTTFQVSSPMSWGSWLYLSVFAVGGLQFAYTLAENQAWRSTRLGKLFFWKWFEGFEVSTRRKLAWGSLVAGIGLGTYTGVLLSTMPSRPLWNSGLMGPLFLISGIAAACALMMLTSRQSQERQSLLRILLPAVLLNLVFVLMWVVDMSHGNATNLEASQMLLGGSYTAAFWALVVVVGLLVPTVLQVQAMRGRWKLSLVAPVLVLFGGLALRVLLVQAGQAFGYGV
ncbi:MAG: polysulfide reductase NrfD [Planctomycetes bacterium]|nr:polysulfide reductase NrfD [Planctomycetota bacterium]